jgi:IstB-like ATP binding protein
MSVATVPVQQATIRQYAKQLQLTTVGGQFLSMAEEAVQQKQGHLSYLERFTTAAQLVNELTEAKNKSELNRVTNRWMRYELIVIDELAYIAMPEAAAELLFQIIAGRAERAAVIATTNLLLCAPISASFSVRPCPSLLLWPTLFESPFAQAPSVAPA